MTGKGFTFTLHIDSYTHIFKIKIFNQNSTFKSVKLLGISEKERALTKFRELWGDTRYHYLFLHLKEVFIRFYFSPETGL